MAQTTFSHILSAMMARTRTRFPVCLVLIPVILLIALPALNGHALDRHGRTGESAWTRMWSFDPDDDDDDDKYFEGTQDDGRTVRILRLNKIAGKPITWAIVITVSGFCVTAFLTQSRRQVQKMKDRCRD